MNAELSILYDECQPDLISYLSYQLRNRETAEDIAHESFAVLVKSSTETEIVHPRRFLFRTAANLAVDYIRHNKVVERHVENLAYDQDNFQTASTEYEVIQDEAFVLLELALADLPTRTRDILILHRLHELNYQQIANNLGISISAVEKHISRGIQHCRLRLGQHLKP